MKKQLIFMLMLVLASVCVSAQASNQYTHQYTETQSSVSGLTQAMVMTRTESQKVHIQEVMNKIQTRHRERLSQLEDLTFKETEEGMVFAEGVGNAKLLGLFNFRYNYRYNVQDNGEVVRHMKFFDFLFTNLEEQL